MDKIQPTVNVPLDLAVQYPDGKEVSSRFGPGKQVMFVTMDGRALFVPIDAGDKIRNLHLRSGQPFRLTKIEIDSGHGRAIDWKAEILPGEQGDGTFVVGKPPAPSPPRSNEGPLASNGSQHTTTFAESPYEHSGASLHLRETVNMLTDVMASCVAYAQRYNGAVKPDDVRSLLISTFINQSKGMRL